MLFKAETKFYNGLLYYGEGGNLSTFTVSCCFCSRFALCDTQCLLRFKKGMCEFLLQCLKPVLLRGSPRFRWADSSHSYRWVVTDFCHNLIYWCLEDRNIYFPLSFHRSCPALYPDVMKWWSVLCISWQHSTTATSMNHEYMTIMLQSLHYFCRIAERGCVHFIFNESPQLLCNDSFIVSNLPHIR